jgi:hypothetical protein
MQIALPDLNTSATLILDRDHRLTDEEYFAFCVANPDLNVEPARCGRVEPNPGIPQGSCGKIFVSYPP